ncbi:MAG TPA: hypothetical protein VN783_06780, partial [Thermoanaerobaculia bacterium]|nr:hypothetical protein [Thermoanaerobaculia bacterium]
MFAAAHLTRDSLRELLAEERSPAADRLLLHLLAICPECREVGGDLLELAERGAIRAPFGPVDVELARSRAQAPALWAELLALPASERRRGLRDRCFLSWGLAERLAEESAARVATEEDAREATDLAKLAVTIARRIPPDDPFEEGWRVQLEALAVAHLAAARLRFG